MDRIRSRILFAVLAGLGFAFSGCVMSTNPLSSPDDAKVDESLCGIWDKSANGNIVDLIMIGVPPAGKVPKGMMMMRTMKLDASKNLTVEPPMLFFVSKIGEVEYWNMILNPQPEKEAPDNFLASFDFDEWVKHPKHAYMFVRCTREKDRITLQTIDTEAMAKAVTAGKLKGNIERDQQNKTVNSVTLTDSTENMRSFLKDAGKEFFKEDNKEEYRKLK